MRQQVQFINQSPNASLIDEYLWRFRDGGTSTQTNPLYFFQGTGWMKVTLTVGYNGCYDSLTTGDSVFIKGPYLKPINYFLNCDSPFTFYFVIDSIEKSNHWSWDFNGDHIPDLNVTHPSAVSTGKDTVRYTYAGRGTYMVYLTAWDNVYNCSFLDSLQVQVTNIHASLTIPHDTLCVGNSYTFDASASQDAISYSYDFGDGFNTGVGTYAYLPVSIFKYWNFYYQTLCQGYSWVH